MGQANPQRCSLCGCPQGQEAFRERCMLPLIDLCDHAGSASCCRLAVRLSSAGQPRSSQ